MRRMTTFILTSAVQGIHWARSLSLAMFMAAACAHAAPPVAPVTVATVPARPGDVQSIDALLRAFYEVVNISPEAPRQWARDRTLYTPRVRFVAISSDGDGRPLVHVWNHQQLVDESEPLVARGFKEREIHRRVRVYGHMAHVDSTYETELAGPTGLQRSRGVNSMELYFDGQRWWIASVVWMTEGKHHPIPADLLP